MKGPVCGLSPEERPFAYTRVSYGDEGTMAAKRIHHRDCSILPARPGDLRDGSLPASRSDAKQPCY